MNYSYDIHIATEGDSNQKLVASLEKLGYKNDDLVNRGLIFNPFTAQYYTSCPLIGIHMSKKLTSSDEVKKNLRSTKSAYGYTGKS